MDCLSLYTSFRAGCYSPWARSTHIDAPTCTFVVWLLVKAGKACKIWPFAKCETRAQNEHLFATYLLSLHLLLQCLHVYPQGELKSQSQNLDKQLCSRGVEQGMLVANPKLLIHHHILRLAQARSSLLIWLLLSWAGWGTTRDASARWGRRALVTRLLGKRRRWPLPSDVSTVFCSTIYQVYSRENIWTTWIGDRTRKWPWSQHLRAKSMQKHHCEVWGMMGERWRNTCELSVCSLTTGLMVSTASFRQPPRLSAKCDLTWFDGVHLKIVK